MKTLQIVLAFLVFIAWVYAQTRIHLSKAKSIHCFKKTFGQVVEWKYFGSISCSKNAKGPKNIEYFISNPFAALTKNMESVFWEDGYSSKICAFRGFRKHKVNQNNYCYFSDYDRIQIFPNLVYAVLKNDLLVPESRIVQQNSNSILYLPHNGAKQELLSYNQEKKTKFPVLNPNTIIILLVWKDIVEVYHGLLLVDLLQSPPSPGIYSFPMARIDTIYIGLGLLHVEISLTDPIVRVLNNPAYEAEKKNIKYKLTPFGIVFAGPDSKPDFYEKILNRYQSYKSNVLSSNLVTHGKINFDLSKVDKTYWTVASSYGDDYFFFRDDPENNIILKFDSDKMGKLYTKVAKSSEPRPLW